MKLDEDQLNGGFVHDKKLKEAFQPTEDVRTTPYPGINELPFPLLESDYLKISSPSKLSVASNGILVAFIGYFIYLIRRFIDSNAFLFEKGDIIITILLIIGYGSSRLFDFFLNKDKREIRNKINNHFRENRKSIEEQRKIYGR